MATGVGRIVSVSAGATRGRSTFNPPVWSMFVIRFQVKFTLNVKYQTNNATEIIRVIFFVE